MSYTISYTTSYTILYCISYTMSYAPTRSCTICSTISYMMSYAISYVFNHHHLRPLKWLACVSDDELCISHSVLIVSHENYMIYSVHCAAARAVGTYTTPPSTHHVTITLYHLMGGVEHIPPLLQPVSPLELICTPPCAASRSLPPPFASRWVWKFCKC